jgi:hypothetical protein
MSASQTALNARTADPLVKPLRYFDESGVSGANNPSGAGPFAAAHVPYDPSSLQPITVKAASVASAPTDTALVVSARDLAPNAAKETGGNLGAVAAASGAVADTAYAGTGPSSIIAALKGIFTKLAGTLTVSDANNASFQGVVAMTATQTYAAQRSVGVNCSLAGNIVFTFPDASTLTAPVAVGWQTLPFAITEWSYPDAGAATVTGVYNLK